MTDISITQAPSPILIRTRTGTVLKIATSGAIGIPVPEPFTPTTDPWQILGPVQIGGGTVVVDAGFAVRNGEAMAIPVLTTAERDAIGTPAASMLIYNTTTGQPEIYDGTIWRKLDQDFQSFVAPLIPTGTTQTVDFAAGRNQVIDLDSATGDVTLTLDNPVAGVVYTIKPIQGAVARDLIWPASVLWPGGTPPVISTGDDEIDLVQLMYDGASFFGLFSQAFA